MGAQKRGICVGCSSQEGFLEGMGQEKTKKHLRKRQGGRRGPCLELLPSLGLLASLVAVWPWTDSWPFCARQGMADEQGVGTHVTYAPQSRQAKLWAALSSAALPHYLSVFRMSSVLPKER